MLAQLERLRDIVQQLRVVGEEVHGVLDTLGADGHADVVEAAEEGLPQLPVLDGQGGVLLTVERLIEMGIPVPVPPRLINYRYM